jgi:cysteinyl-tRNA synthetase
MLEERVALLVRLLGQSKKNPETYEFLSTEIASLNVYLRSIQERLAQVSDDAKNARTEEENPAPDSDSILSSVSKNAFEFLRTDLDTALTFMDLAESQSYNVATRTRNHTNARRAYDTVVRLMQNLSFDEARRKELAEKLALLKSRLQNAGQQF